MATPTPNFQHIGKGEFRAVYEPAEDTFLFLDALEKEKELLLGLGPLLCLEIGSGSGVVITFLGQLLKSQQPLMMATDLSCVAARATQNHSSV
eukprot:TRINITY_DN1907_c0_g1_i1.p2 TRINITY_DN1907_c0_g1~~TRINITY_DN1907_c0_g1_i1.p2  ORF type:complete len:106 (-),score=28.88 TRINITY_DN1907_c0_g1_i1:638-916(-)